MKFSYFASGFREDRGSHTGTRLNFEEVRGLYQSGDCGVIYCEWHDDPKGHARELASQWVPGDVVTLCGYSWGCGNWVKKFLCELWKLRPIITVDHLIMVDPVVRSRWPWMRWLAVSDWGEISLPANVRKSHIFYQRENEPNASNVRIGSLIKRPDQRLFVTHTKIDNAPEVTAKVLSVAAEYLAQKKPTD